MKQEVLSAEGPAVEAVDQSSTQGSNKYLFATLALYGGVSYLVIGFIIAWLLRNTPDADNGLLWIALLLIRTSTPRGASTANSCELNATQLSRINPDVPSSAGTL